MGGQAQQRGRLRVVPGYRRVSIDLAGVRIVAAREDDAPFGVDAVVLEEDTWLALSTPADLVTPPGHPVRVMTRVWEAKPEKPGTVIVRRGNPIRLLAVVHDLDAEPTWTESRTAEALAAVFGAVAREGVRSLQLPMLATRHGKLPAERFLEMLRSQLEHAVAEDTPLQRLWLVREDHCGSDLLRTLASGHDQ